MGLNKIIQGHVNEVLGQNQSISERRMEICKQCPLYKESMVGPICNSRLWYNPSTGETSTIRQMGFKNGCGCRLNAKTRLQSAKCTLGKW